MFGNFTKKVRTKSEGRAERFELNEVLAILDMQEGLTDQETGKVDKETISKVTGRSIHSLNYKIFEGQTTIKGKTNVRSVKKHWYVDPKDKDSEFVDAEEAMKRLFKSYGETFVDWDDVQNRITAYCDARGIVTEEETTEEAV